MSEPDSFRQVFNKLKSCDYCQFCRFPGAECGEHGHYIGATDIMSCDDQQRFTRPEPATLDKSTIPARP